MITEERRKEMLRYWENEDVPEDQVWRLALTAEEYSLVKSWDRKYAEGLSKMGPVAGDCNRII